MLRAVIFDLDGVIVDTMNLHFEAAEEVLNEAGANVTKEGLKKFDTTRSSDAFKKILEGKSEGEVKKLVEEKYRRLSKMVPRLKPYPGFNGLFAAVSAKHKTAVVSSSVRSFVESVLAHIGVRGKISAVFGGDDVPAGKPSPDGYLMAAKALKVKPEECLVIEDSIYGVMAAKRAGMKCVAVTNTYGKNFLLDADFIVDSLEGLSLEKLEALFSA